MLCHVSIITAIKISQNYCYVPRICNHRLPIKTVTERKHPHTHTAHLLRARSTSSFFQRKVGLGSPWTWHLNSTLSSTKTTWFTGRCTNTGLSESGQNILHRFDQAFEVRSKPWKNVEFFFYSLLLFGVLTKHRELSFFTLSLSNHVGGYTHIDPCVCLLCVWDRQLSSTNLLQIAYNYTEPLHH